MATSTDGNPTDGILERPTRLVGILRWRVFRTIITLLLLYSTANWQLTIGNTIQLISKGVEAYKLFVELLGRQYKKSLYERVLVSYAACNTSVSNRVVELQL